MTTYSRLVKILSCLPDAFIVCGLIGCSTASLTIDIPKAGKPPATGGFLAGVAKVDITPLPGYPLCGFGPEGRISRGVWTRLHAHSVYLEDRLGNNLVMVSCDLWSMPGGLADRVAEIVSKEGKIPIGRDRMIIAATHTHLGPGNFTSWEIYNTFASSKEGFDENLFEFLSHRIAQSVEQAFSSRTPAILRYGAGRVDTLGRNRSLDAFMQNPERDEILSENASVKTWRVSPLYPDSLAYRAIDPNLRILRIDRVLHGDTSTIGVAAFIAVHPNAMGEDAEVYSSDLFGVAESEAGRMISSPFSPEHTPPVVAIFNGAEGDVSPVWETHDRKTTLQLGHRLARKIAECWRVCTALDVDTIAYQYGTFDFADVCFNDSGIVSPGEPSKILCTDANAVPGDPALGGAEDGRTLFYTLGFREGLKGERDSRQSPKQIAFDPKFLPQGERAIVNLFTESLREKSAPRNIPLGVYKVGPLIFATLPGECTTTLGRRIRGVIQAGQPEIRDVVNIGLANEYLLYFTTPEEYEVQDYEGASTLYGGASGSLLMNYIRDLARSIGARHEPLPEKVTYLPGSAVNFSIADIGVEPFSVVDGLSTILTDTASGLPVRNFPRVTWRQNSIPLLADMQTCRSAIPSVWIEKKGGDGRWIPVEGESNDGLDFVTLAVWVADKSMAWSAIWIVPDDFNDSQVVRFAGRDCSGTLLVSGEFTLESIVHHQHSPFMKFGQESK